MVECGRAVVSSPSILASAPARVITFQICMSLTLRGVFRGVLQGVNHGPACLEEGVIADEARRPGQMEGGNNTNKRAGAEE